MFNFFFQSPAQFSTTLIFVVVWDGKSIWRCWHPTTMSLPYCLIMLFLWISKIKFDVIHSKMGMCVDCTYYFFEELLKKFCWCVNEVLDFRSVSIHVIVLCLVPYYGMLYFYKASTLVKRDKFLSSFHFNQAANPVVSIPIAANEDVFLWIPNSYITHEVMQVLFQLL